MVQYLPRNRALKIHSSPKQNICTFCACIVALILYNYSRIK